MRGARLDDGLGGEIDEPSVDDVRRALLAFERSGEEPSEILLIVRGDSISWLADGTAQMAAPVETGARSLAGVDRKLAETLFLLFLASDYEALEQFGWRFDGGAPETPEERHAHEQRYFAGRVGRAAAAMLEALGPERADVLCRRDGCHRGAVEHSVLCRDHHVEQVTGRTCPSE